MAYTANVPQATQKISGTQGLILANFTGLEPYLDVNHVDINANVDAGKHKYITMPQQTPDNVPTTGPTELSIYSALSAINITQNALWLQKQNNALEFEWTEFSTVATSATQGYISFQLPNSLIVIVCQVNIPGGGVPSFIFTFPVITGIPSFTTAPYVLITPTISTSSVTAYDHVTSVSLANVTKTSFQIVFGNNQVSIANMGITYMAIGF